MNGLPGGGGACPSRRHRAPPCSVAYWTRGRSARGKQGGYTDPGVRTSGTYPEASEVGADPDIAAHGGRRRIRKGRRSKGRKGPGGTRGGSKYELACHGACPHARAPPPPVPSRMAET